MRRAVASTSGYTEAVAKMEGRPYEDVVASHEVFVSIMKQALQEKLPAKVVQMFRKGPTPQEKTDGRNSCSVFDRASQTLASLSLSCGRSTAEPASPGGRAGRRGSWK